MAARDRRKSAESKKKEVEEVIDQENEEPTIQWALQTLEQISLLRELTVDEVQLKFEDVLQFKNQQTCLKEAALLDYFVSGFWWAKEMNFSSEQTSFVMALLQSSIDNISEKQMSFVDNFTEFGKTLIDLRKTPSADGNPPLFDVEQAKSITNDFTSSLFQHYRMYEFLFSQSRDKKLLGMERHIEVIDAAKLFAPLEEGMPVDVFQHYLAPAQPESPEEQAAKERRGEEEEEEEEKVGGTDERSEREGERGDTLEEEEEEEEKYSVEEVREVLREMTKEMMGNLQAEFTEKLRIQEESYTARIERLKSVSSN
ncbi:ciliary-associated calcium-binding coiled-coil protein 1 isoform X1 [Alosa sapidissima]|uniref:ciliary-associated calcium-binding coiled-coil protein 1 isoform X1 n=1 Tax=Alosa sapidissima TaxID=34773 RepID=UPI001C08602D|nr:ciliary-associated calcium-binding coiled-coil protein 1 isoform X1 [Alosa sapidissima]